MNNPSVRTGMTITIIAVPFIFGIVAILTLAYMAGIDLSAMNTVPVWQTSLMTMGLLFIAFLVMVALVGVFNNILDGQEKEKAHINDLPGDDPKEGIQ